MNNSSSPSVHSPSVRSRRLSSHSVHLREESCDRASLDLQPQTPNPQEDKRNSKDKSQRHESIELQRSPWILVLAGFYSILAISSWIILCILTFRPLTTNSYEATVNGTSPRYYHPTASTFVTNEKWYRAARVIQSITGVLTIPLASAVCSNAAVIFVQRYGKANNMTIRQLLALSDKGWTDTDLYWKFAKNPVRCWKRYFTHFLLMAFALHVLGGLISPLQTLLLSVKSTKVPGNSFENRIPELIQTRFINDPSDMSLSAIASAAIPALAGNIGYSQYLWQSSGTHCTKSKDRTEEYCGSNMTLGSLSNLQDPFIAQVPNGFNTGVLRQYAPRLNSSAQVESLGQSELPAVCNTDRSFHVTHKGTDWAVQVCYPLITYANATRGLESTFEDSPRNNNSPWRKTRDRQDVSEDLFLSFRFTNQSRIVGPQSPYVMKQTWRVTSNTTSGWFELPNYMNSDKPGALEDKDPTSPVGRDMVTQISGANGGDVSEYIGNVLKARNIGHEYGDSDIDNILAPGPLLILAYSVFGAKDSYMATCATTLNNAAFSNYTDSINVRYCAKQPLSYWFSPHDTSDVDAYKSVFGEDRRSENDFSQFSSWLWSIGSARDNKDMEFLNIGFRTGLYIAIIAWHRRLRIDSGRLNTIPIISDSGADTSIPDISVASISVISTMLLVYLFFLLWLASYAAFSPRWTGSLNGFTMMRIGSAIADRVPLLVTYEEDQITVLDEIPGWIGSTPDKESKNDSEKAYCGSVAELELGAADQLRERQRYKCYPLEDQ